MKEQKQLTIFIMNLDLKNTNTIKTKLQLQVHY